MPTPTYHQPLAWLALLTLTSACLEGPLLGREGIGELTADVSATVGTVMELSWTTDGEGYSWVEYGPTMERELRTPVTQEASSAHHFFLFGLPSNHEVHFRVVTVVDGVEYAHEGEATTGGLPPALPDFRAMEHDPTLRSDAPFLMTSLPGIENHLAVLDRQGEVLWYFDRGTGWEDHMVWNVAFVPNSNKILCGAFSRDPDAWPSEAVTIDLLGNTTSVTEIDAAHHALARLPDGTLATIQPDTRSWYDPDLGEEVDVIGDAVVEYAPDGSQRTVFSTWDWREPEVHERFYKPASGEGDWSHANALKYDEVSGTYLFSLGNLDTVLQLSASTGEVVRELGKKGYAVTEGTPFTFQHDPSWTPEGTLLMSASLADGRAFVAEYEVDDLHKELHELWSYGQEATFLAVAGGGATRLDNGNTLFNVGYQGVVVELSPAGQPIWEVATSMGAVFSSPFFFDDFYEPPTP